MVYQRFSVSTTTGFTCACPRSTKGCKTEFLNLPMNIDTETNERVAVSTDNKVIHSDHTFQSQNNNIAKYQP